VWRDIDGPLSTAASRALALILRVIKRDPKSVLKALAA
jgi:hypothetical protein